MPEQLFKYSFRSDIVQMDDHKKKKEYIKTFGEDAWKHWRNKFVRSYLVLDFLGIESTKLELYELIDILSNKLQCTNTPIVIDGEKFYRSEIRIEHENGMFGRSYLLVYFNIIFGDSCLVQLYYRDHLGDTFDLNLPYRPYSEYHDVKRHLRQFENLAESLVRLNSISYDIPGYDMMLKRCFVHIRLIRIEHYKEIQEKIKANNRARSISERNLPKYLSEIEIPEGFTFYKKTDEDYLKEGRIEKDWYKLGDTCFLNEIEYMCEELNKCPICLKRTKEKTPKGQSYRPTCSDPVCRETHQQIQWTIYVNAYEPIPEECELPTYWIENGDGIKRTYYANNFNWKYWVYRDDIETKRSEVMAVMYLNGKIKLLKEAIPHLDKNYCKPIKYKQSINQFSYETNKSNADTLRNYGWSDLLLSGITPTRSKSSKHAKHHQPG